MILEQILLPRGLILIRENRIRRATCQLTPGSGTTCRSALQLGRQYIGIDISHEYCEIAKERIKSIESQPTFDFEE